MHIIKLLLFYFASKGQETLANTALDDLDDLDDLSIFQS